MKIGAVVTRTRLPTTSSKGRYALRATFAPLFDLNLKDEACENKFSRGRNGT